MLKSQILIKLTSIVQDFLGILLEKLHYLGSFVVCDAGWELDVELYEEITLLLHLCLRIIGSIDRHAFTLDVVHGLGRDGKVQVKIQLPIVKGIEDHWLLQEGILQ